MKKMIISNENTSRATQLEEARRHNGDALKQSAVDYRRLFENAHDAILIFDPANEIILEVNQRACEIYGYERAELIGMSIEEISQNVSGGKRYIKNTLEQNTKQNFETVQYRKDGTEMLLEINARSVEYDGRHAILSINRDITDRKHAEEKLKQSEERLRALFEASRDGILVEDNEQIAYVNNAYARLLGYNAPEELIGQHVSIGLAPEEEERMLEFGRQRARGEQPPTVYEFKAKRRDGSYVAVEASIATYTIAGKVYITTMIRDITERHAVEKALRESEARYRELIENARDIIYTHDLKGNFTSLNSAGEQATGYTRDIAYSMNIADVIAPEHLSRAREMISRKAHGESLTIYNLDIINKEGRRIELEVSSRPIMQNNVPVGVQGIARDVTERNQLEAQLRQAQKMEAIGQLAGGIAHDFNNLLTAINGYSELTLMRMNADDRWRRNLEQIKKAGDRAMQLTGQLLAFSRKQILQPKIVELNAIVADMDKMLKRLVGENINLIAALDPTLGHVNADPGQLEQILLNLVVNARDAMPSGGDIIIKTSNVELCANDARVHDMPVAPGACVMLSFTDTGCGMDAETQRRIFEPFFTTKEEGKGTGLGLSTVYGIVKQSLGSVRVESAPGKGTTFSIYLPRVDDPLLKTDGDSATEDAPRGTETILLVEDEELVRNMTREILEAQGYAVVEANDPREAMRISGQHAQTIRLLLTDVVMPHSNGRELAGQLQSVCPHLRVLYMSGYADDAIFRHGVLDGSVPFLQKPFTPAALAYKVREVLDAA